MPTSDLWCAPGLSCVARYFCGAGFLACGRLSSRPWPPLPTALLHPIAAAKWSKPPGLPCRRSRRQSNTHATRTGLPNAIQPARLRAPPQPAASLPISVSSVFSVVCFSPCPPCPPWFAFSVFSVVCFFCALRVVSDVRPAFQQALAPFTHRPLRNPIVPPPWSKPPGLPCRRSRRQSHTIPSCAGAPTPSGPHDCALHLNPPPLSPSPCPPCSLWFAFSVPSVSCPMWGRLSSLRPAFQPALAPFTHRPFSSPLHARPKFSL